MTMRLKNTPERFGAVSKALHWTIALLIVCLIAFGLYLTSDVPATVDKIRLFPVHKEFGILVLMLASLRVLWHIASRPPGFAESLKAWEKRAARAVHLLLYAAMFVMPLSGWFLSSAAGRPVSFFGLFTLPDFVARSKDTQEFFSEVHEFVGWALIPLIGLHAAAALKHHFLDKDITLRRMLPFGLRDNDGR